MINSPKIVLITGCSSGFGLLTAARLASHGHKVIATMRDLKKQGSLLSEVTRRKAQIDVCPLDVRDKKSIADTMHFIIAKYGYLDVLVNNAGYGVGGFFEDLTDEEIRDQFETNFWGVQNMVRAVLPIMRPRRSGKIINISSVSGFSAQPAFSAYASSKWALEAFSESLYHEVKLFGIDVHLIEPGTYNTPIFSDNARYAKNFDNPQSPYHIYSQVLKKRVQDYVQHDCHKDPEEVAALVEKLILAKSAPFRNIPDWEGKIHFLFRKILPFNVFSFLISRILFKGVSKKA
jgi:NAD(P)-dependent dehydrogenase (short-subunit alcohol dehydrogenase family)